MKRLRILLVVAAALALAGSAAGSTTAENRAAAQRDAEQLLQRLVLPAGARRLQHPPGGAGGLLGGPFQIPSGKLVDRHLVWRVNDPLASVIAFVRAHPPHGAQKEGSGSGSVGGPHYPKNETLTFAFPESSSLSLRWLNVTMVALPDGSTGVRADAQDIWVVARPRSEVVPARVRQIDIGSHRVTDAGMVAKIVRWFDALPIVQPGADFSCPALVAGPTITLLFRGSNGVLARASFGADTMNHSLLSEPCTPIRFEIGTRMERPLLGGRFLLRVQRLLGEKLL